LRLAQSATVNVRVSIAVEAFGFIRKNVQNDSR
jgi:hypothetical protein